MSYTGKFKLPYRIVNGVKQFVTIETWAEETLDPTALALFRTAKAREDAIWEREKAAGNVTITSLDVNGVEIKPKTNVVIDTWPQVMTISINGSTPKTGLFNSDFTSNLPTLAPSELAGTHTIVNHTAGYTYQKFFDSNGKFISMTDRELIEAVDIPVAAIGQYTWKSDTFRPDPEFATFSDQYRADPGLTWDSDSEQFTKN
jgi:hypothetical protein